jgi:predicted house-cleaning NTP pyrophosphatase (Maf/HAM1 superfamily)
MDHIKLGNGTYEGEIRYVLTADTMGCDGQERVHGKPKDKEDAYRKIRALSGTYRTATGFCIEKRVWQHESWKTLLQKCEVVSSFYTFRVPDHRLDDYFEHSL